MKKLFYYTFFTVVICGLIACEKDFLDVNTDLNNPTSASADLVLPTGLGFTAYVLGNPYQILGGIWSQYWTQGPTGSQYKTEDQYTVVGSDFDRQWQDLYAGSLNDFKDVIDQGTKLNRKNHAAIGKIMQAFVYQYLTDLHGDIPFSEALNPLNQSPKFDSQEKVYDGLIRLVDEGLALIDENSSEHPHNDDLLFGGDMHAWKKFANTLKLRIYLRQAYVRSNVAESGIKAMYTAGAEFLGTGEDASIKFTTEVFNRNPLFATYQTLGSDNLVASLTAINYFQITQDPRINVFYQSATAAPSQGNHAGLLQGNGVNLNNQNANSYSKPGPAVGGPNGGEAAPVIFLSAAESYFLQAESVVRGWGTGNAKALYDNGVKASFQRCGLTATSANTYLAQPSMAFPSNGSSDERIKAIIFQKWASMTGSQNLEAWTEWRRTGFPDILTVSVSSNIGNKFPARILYPSSEATRNPNTPPQRTISDKVWWDVNTTGQN